MRGALIFAILIVAGLMIAGCTGPTPSAKPPNTTGGASGGGSSGGASGSGSGSEDSGAEGGEAEGGDSGPDSGADTGGSDDGSSGTDSGSGDDLAGQSYEALAALGVPLQCDITVTSEGTTTTAKVYMKGAGEVRSEMSINEPDATCTKMVSIMKGDDYYMGCISGSLFPQCDWLHITASDTPAGPSGGSSSPPDYSDVPPAKISCAPWVYDPSKFSTPGTVCTMEDLMGGYTGGYPTD